MASSDIMTPNRPWEGALSLNTPDSAAADLYTVPDGIPPGWPTHLQSPLAWTGADLAGDEAAYVYQLTEAEVGEITSALRFFQGLHLGVDAVSKATFPLPTLQHKLSALRVKLFEDKGFFILRGLQPQMFSDEENSIVCLGVSSYIREKRMQQNREGEMIRHIIDADWTGAPASQRQFGYSNVKHDFHSDFACDVLVMYTVNTSASGGNSNLASSWRIYNELAATRPDVIRTLAECKWAHDTYGVGSGYFHRSLLHCSNGKVVLNFERRGLVGSSCAPRSAGIPRCTAAQQEALDMVQALASQHQLSMRMHAGDMRFINNFGLLHSRDAFTDEGGAKRHLIRLWLLGKDQGDEGWQVPDGLMPIMEQMGSCVDVSWPVSPVLTAEQVMNRTAECS